MSTVFGVDVGGSGIKGAPVDLERGQLTTERIRIETPRPATPKAVVKTISRVVDDGAWEGVIGVSVPSVVINGITKTAANIHKSWVDIDIEAMLAERFGQPVPVLNDADAAGLAEMRFGAGRDVRGVVLLLTLGTGVGSALFVDGVRIPNTEFGHLEYRGGPAEHRVAARLVEDEGVDLKPWAKDLSKYLRMLHRALFPTRIIIGGGISKRFGEFSKWIDVDTEVVAAKLRNDAGIVGAALYAHQPDQENT